MDKEFQKKKPEQKEKDSSLNLILFSTLAITLLFLVELFLLIVMPQMLPEIAAVGVVIVGCTYLDLSTCVKRIRKKEQAQEEQNASILKSEKAAYLLIRKYFDEIEEQMTLMEEKFAEPFQGVIAAQKATAKVTINRNKENTDALMNSNDKLLELVLNLEDKIEAISKSLSSGLDERVREQNVALLQKQTEMTNQMRELELSLRNEILQAVNKLSMVSPQMMMAPPQMMQMQQPVSAPVNREPEPLMPDEMENTNDLGSLGDLPDFVPLDAVEEECSDAEASLEEVYEEPEPMVEPEPEPIAEPVVEELPPMPDLSDPNRQMSPDEIEALLANMNAESSALAEEPMVEPEPEPIAEPVVEELPPMPDLSDPNRQMSPDEIEALLANMNAESSALAEEPMVEPEPEPIAEPVVEELPPMPDLSDPNRQMSPDEIAALLANMNAESSALAEEPMAEPEPEPIPEPVVEEKPPMPDLSDPNKIMSPDEIEALLASMAADTASAEALPDVGEPEPVVEEKPPMPDLSDPNRQMSPDEIAALFANLG